MAAVNDLTPTYSAASDWLHLEAVPQSRILDSPATIWGTGTRDSAHGAEYPTHR
jgi:hypothetical protein